MNRGALLSTALPITVARQAPANWGLGAAGAAYFIVASAGLLAGGALFLHLAPPSGGQALRFALALPFAVLLAVALAYRDAWRALADLVAATSALLVLWALSEAMAGGASPLGLVSSVCGGAAGVTLLFTIRAVSLHLNRQAQHIQSAGERDQLTGLPNRAGMARLFSSLPAAESGALIFLNLNDFQALNERDGHDAGDNFLRMAAATIQPLLPRRAVATRWGGDEFIIFLPGLSELEARELAVTLDAALPSPRSNLPPFASGTAVFVAGESLDRVLATADDRMRRVKEEQRTKFSRLSGETVSLDGFAAQLELLDTPENILRAGLATARLALHFDISVFFRRYEESFSLVHVDGEAPAALRAMIGRYAAGRGDGLAGRAAFDNATVWTADYPREPDARPEWKALGVRSLCLAPVRERGRVVALVGLANLTGWRPVTPTARRSLEAIAARMGVVLERRQAVSEVRRTLEGSLLAIGLALEGRDLETAGHTERVVTLADLLGRAMGLRGAALEAVKQGAYLHDVGKLVVPDAVLLKPGRLDPEEWEQMQAHAVKGFNLAVKIPTLPVGALEIIRNHHERWDGRGYPDGLAGEAIPLKARIFAICDVYDALVSTRPYKRAWSHQEAIVELRARAGTQFDPTVVKAFVELVVSSVAVNETLTLIS